MEISKFGAKDCLSALLHQVKQGAEVIITHHGRATVSLVPVSDAASHEARRALIARIRARAAARRAGPFNWSEWKALRDEGRP